MRLFKQILIFVAIMSAAGGALAAEASHELQKDFNVSSGGKLIVNVNGSDIMVRTWDKAQVQMTVENIGDDADRVHSEQDRNTVIVNYRTHGGMWNNNNDVRFHFYVPKQFNLDLTTSGGDIGTAGALTGNVLLTTSGGNLTIDKVNGKVNGRTSGGDVTVNSVGDNSELATSGGNIKVENAGGNLKLSTSGGDISVGDVGGALEAFTAGGNVHIRKVGGELQASTSSGDVTVGNVGGSAAIFTSGGNIYLTSANGRVKASTSGGDVDINGVVGSVNASSSGGTVKVSLTPKGSGRSEITSTGGDVYLFIPAGASASIQADVAGGNSKDDIDSDFPMTTHGGHFGFEKAEIVLHGGGQEINLRTTSGTVYVKKMSSIKK